MTQIITDSGPLIDLAVADRLDLLQSFGRPVLIVDVVREESTRKLGAPGEQRLSEWFNLGGGNQFQIIPTPFFGVYRDALKKVESGEDLEATKGMGDATIAWLLANLKRLRAPDDIALLLTQDGPFGDGPVVSMHATHVLSTREWLKTLERLGVIESARQIIGDIESGGRKVSRYMADRPARFGAGTKSDWKDGVSDWISNEGICPACRSKPCRCQTSDDNLSL